MAVKKIPVTKEIWIREMHYGNPMLQISDIAERANVSADTVRNRIREMRRMELFGSRYDETEIIDDGNLVWLSIFVWWDFEKYRKSLKDRNAKKYVPPYDQAVWAKTLGYYSLPAMKAVNE